MAEWSGSAPEVIEGEPVTSNDDVRKYVVEIEVYDRVSQKFRTRGNKILRRYRDERRTADEDQIKFNILWSNIQTLLPACYAKNPKPECERRFKDDDPVGRVGSEILERSITYYMDCGDFFDSARSATLDRLLPGRGQMWVRYVPHFRDVDNDSDDAGTPEVKQEGPEVTDSSDEMVERDASMIGSDPSDVEDGQEVEYEEVCCDYVHWENFGHNVARTWDEVYLVWRMVFLDRDELIERFGADLGKRIPLDYSPKNLAEEKITQEMKKATVYEMWDKRCKKAFWVSKKVPEFLDERDDPLKLEKFFPCPKPLLATVANDSILPTADYSEYQDQARELDALTARIAAVTRALKVAGVYAADATGIDRLLSEGTENQLIPIEQWAMFAEKGGLKGVFELFPIQDIAQTLLAMYQARDKIKADLYEVSGMPDIIRGANDPRSTATAESIKGQYASIRLRSVQDEVQRFMRDMIRLMGEVIANHISYQTLAQVSGVKLMTRMEKMQAQLPQQQYQQAMQQYQMAGQHVKQMQASGQPMPPGFQPPPPPQPPPPLPAAVQEQLSEPSWEDVEDMLRSNAMRTFRLDIETDSTIGDDDETTKQQRLEFLKVLGPLIAQAVQAGETNPTMVPMMIESIKWAVRAFPQARSLEGIIDQTLDLLAKQPPPPKPNPEAIKAQAQQQAQQAKMQGEQQIQQMRAKTDQQIEAGKVQGQIQVENVKAQAQIQIGQAQQQAQAAQAQQENELEAKRDLLKAQTEVQIAQVKGDVDFRIAVAVARIHAEATIAAARINSKTSPSDGTADLAYQELHETEAGNGVAMVSGPGEPTPQPQGSDDADL